MRIHQQRVPIISPLDRDYHRRSHNSDDLSVSNTALSSFDNFDSVNLSSKSKSNLNQSTYRGSELVAAMLIDSVNLRFTIVGERDIK